MKKETIYIDLDDEITTITDRVQNSKGDLIALVLPKHCVVLQSAVNMKILNKIAKNNGKRLVLITNEASLLPLAGAAKLYVAKTLQSKPYLPDAQKLDEPITTIDEKDEAGTLDASKPIGELALVGGEVTVDDESPIELDEESVDKATSAKDQAKKDKKLRIPNFNKFRIWLILVTIVVIALIGGGVYAARALPRATVTVTTQNQSATVSITVTGSLTAQTVDLDNKIVPAEIKTIDQTVTKIFQATGEKNIGDKATGEVLFYNCSKEDKLSDTERTIPAGTAIVNSGFTFITQGDVVVQPSGFNGDNCKYDKASVAVGVTAQSGGDSYNLSPRDYSVPALSSMTATDENGMGGGTNKLVTAISQADCDSAKNDLLATKTDDYKNQLSAQLSTAGLLPLRDTFVSAASEVTCNPAVGVEASESTATLSFKLSMTGANMASLDQLVKAEVAKQANQQSVFDTGVKNAIVSVKEKAANGDVVFGLQVDAQTGMQQNGDTIANLIAGKKYGESLAIIKSQSGVADVKINYSPFWVSGTPKNTQRITVNFISQ